MNTYLLFKERLSLSCDYFVQLQELHMKVHEQVFKTNYVLFLTLEYCVGTLEQYSV